MAQVQQNLQATAGDGAGVTGVAPPDPGEGAFAAYAGAARGERKREQEMLLGFLLRGTPAEGAAKGPASSLFTSELLTLLSEERAGAPTAASR